MMHLLNATKTGAACGCDTKKRWSPVLSSANIAEVDCSRCRTIGTRAPKVERPKQVRYTMTGINKVGSRVTLRNLTAKDAAYWATIYTDCSVPVPMEEAR